MFKQSLHTPLDGLWGVYYNPINLKSKGTVLAWNLGSKFNYSKRWGWLWIDLMYKNIVPLVCNLSYPIPW